MAIKRPGIDDIPNNITDEFVKEFFYTNLRYRKEFLNDPEIADLYDYLY